MYNPMWYTDTEIPIKGRFRGSWSDIYGKNIRSDVEIYNLKWMYPDTVDGRQ
jgi:hypothetical protein